MHTYSDYLENSLNKIKKYLFDMKTRPILFIGSGISQRYIDAPTWRELLEQLVNENPDIKNPLQYYLQEYSNDYPKIASVLTKKYRDYAWNNRNESDEFPIFTFESTSSNIHLKYKISSILKNKMENFNPDNHELSNELNLLKKLNPQAIITTNYDNLLETLFPKYETIVGQEVIYKRQSTDIGHILKIHGSIEDYDSIIIEEKDYYNFEKKQIYLNAKLLTYFMEHPVFFIGYSLGDENIKSILYDIKQISDADTEPMVKNMWFIDWSKEPILNQRNVPPQVKSISVGNGESVRINYIKLHEYDELYKALYQDSIDLSALKLIEETVYNLVKSDTITDLEVDIASLHYLTDREKLLKAFTKSSTKEIEEGDKTEILTFANITDPNELAIRFPLTPTQLSSDIFDKKDYHWSHAYKLIDSIYKKTGINLRDSNNNYHVKIPGGITRYSMDMVKLLKKEKESEPFEIELDNAIISWKPEDD